MPQQTYSKRSPLMRVLRVFLPAVIILVWFAAAGVGGPYFGKVDEVSTNSQAAYLPESAEATQVQNKLTEFAGSAGVPALLVYSSDAVLDADMVAAITASRDAVAAYTELQVSPPIFADDKRAAQVFVGIPEADEISDVVSAVRDTAAAELPAGVKLYVTGPAGLANDLSNAFSGIDGILLLVALSAVLVILVLVYRSLLLPLLVLATSVFSLCAALLTVWWLAKWEILLLSGQTQGILFILVIGAATDYSLLLVARFREELRQEQDKWAALKIAWRQSLEPILASGGTVIAGLLTLLLSDLKSNSSLGPVAAIGIVFAMCAALTLLPALLFATGRAAFWPRLPRFDAAYAADDAAHYSSDVWAKTARFVGRKPRAVWVTTLAVLVVGCFGLLQLHADGVPASDLVLGESEARTGQEVLSEHFPGGSGSPAQVVAPEADMLEVAAALRGVSGVSSVSVAADVPGGAAPVTADGIAAFGPPGTPAPEPTVVDGDVLLQATLDTAADSAQAETTVQEIREAVRGVNDSAQVGGVTAIALDTKTASIHDRNLIIPVILAVILVILMLLLRAVVAPVLLIITTVLSFGTALGVSALVFNHVLGLPGADPAVPLFGFVFLVALGIDYNIFLMTRVREESLKHGTREGILRGLTVTGGVITSAGIVLAATFAALSVLPILFLLQLAFIVAFGVLLDTFVVRSLLVPALSLDIGKKIWWPSRLSK